MAAASVTPQSTATRASFQMMRQTSLYSISPSERPRTIETEAWLPALPPVSISIGIKPVSTTDAASASSNELMMLPVNVAETIRISSHGMRFFHVANTPVFMYGRSVGVIAAMTSISSVASS